MQDQPTPIRNLFHCTSDICKRNVDSLLIEAEQQLGQLGCESLRQQWKLVSQKLNNSSKLTCLSDRNHRRMLIEFIRAESAQLYKSSYFNRAKIDPQYITYLRQIGPYFFSEVITIVNKLKLIHKHYTLKMNKKMLSENHIDIKIMRILELCSSKQRSINNNLNKFKSIVEFEDREQLTKELGKMLRASWSNEKKTVKINNDPSEKAVTVVNDDDDIGGIMLVESYQYQRKQESSEFDWS